MTNRAAVDLQPLYRRGAWHGVRRRTCRNNDAVHAGGGKIQWPRQQPQRRGGRPLFTWAVAGTALIVEVNGCSKRLLCSLNGWQPSSTKWWRIFYGTVLVNFACLDGQSGHVVDLQECSGTFFGMMDRALKFNLILIICTPLPMKPFRIFKYDRLEL